MLTVWLYNSFEINAFKSAKPGYPQYIFADFDKQFSQSKIISSTYFAECERVEIEGDYMTNIQTHVVFTHALIHHTNNNIKRMACLKWTNDYNKLKH